jgi:uncharacterized protein with ParB-like and HNH nuclease domain
MSYNIQRTTFKVSDFVTWYRTNSLVLNPDFQRRSVWNSKAKSYLIDTIIRGLPIPVIILRDTKTSLDTYIPIKEVVDGQQRLRTVISFVTGEFNDVNEFKLSKTHNEIFGGNSFSTLPNDAKQDILDYEFFVHVLPSTVSNREILEIFSRMNSTGVKLNDQELRNASYFGDFKSLAFKIANQNYDSWIKWGVFTDSKIARMEEVELVNDLLIISMQGIDKRTPEFLSSFYKNYDDEESIPKKEIISNRIQNVLNFIDDVYGNVIKTTEFKKTPLLYSLFANIYFREYSFDLTKSNEVKIKLNKKDFRVKLDNLANKLKIAKLEWKEHKTVKSVPEKVFDGYSRGTSAKENREVVFKFLEKELF